MSSLILKKLNSGNRGKAEMSFMDHLEELRWHIVRSVIVVIILAIFIFINIDWIFDNIIYGPMRQDFISYRGLCALGHWLHIGDALCMPAPNVEMQVTTFGSQFMGAIGIALIGGFIIAIPYILWEVWRFIKPALNPQEIKSSRGGIFWVSFFFILGVSFGYFMLAPFTFSFLSNFKLGTLQALQTKPTLDDYIENMTNIIIGTGLSFELPVISSVLTRIGLITPKFLKDYRKFAYVIILIVAAVITPSPDWTSQVIVSIPLFILYEISIQISSNVMKENLRKEKEFFAD